MQTAGRRFTETASRCEVSGCDSGWFHRWGRLLPSSHRVGFPLSRSFADGCTGATSLTLVHRRKPGHFACVPLASRKSGPTRSDGWGCCP